MQADDQSAQNVAKYSKSLELKIVVKNNTSNKEIRAHSDQPISISEILDKGFVLNLPPQAGQQGHQLLLDVQLSEANKQILVLSATAKILEVDHSDPGVLRATVKFAQFDPFIWKKFLRTYQACQDELAELLTSLKGSRK